MDWLVTATGAALVLLILRDVFHTLWHPTRHGGLSRLVMTTLWRLSFVLGPRRTAAGLAGPLAMVSVVALWALTVAAGWALIYWPHIPDAFVYAGGLQPDDHAGLLDATYVSWSRSPRSVSATSHLPRAGCASSHPWRRWSGSPC